MARQQVIVPAPVRRSLSLIGQTLRRARLARKETQALAAERIGVHVQTVRRLEAGQPEVASGHLLALLYHYGHGEALQALVQDSPATVGFMAKTLAARGSTAGRGGAAAKDES